jgi:probable F420-dependent oxidoreductase
MSDTYALSGTGIWSAMLRFGDPSEVAELAAEMEGLGYSALWIPDTGGDVWTPLTNLLAATQSVTIATGILNIWMHAPDEAAAQHAALTAQHGHRFLCGIGVSHRPFIDHVNEPGHVPEAGGEGGRVPRRPRLGARRRSPAGERCIAALGPKMLELAASRTSGTHPYLVTPEHTATAREAVGPDGLVASEQAVVLDTNPETARAAARTHLKTYLGLPNYTNNWKRIGFTDDDLADGGSDRLVDALVAWGDEDAIVARGPGPPRRRRQPRLHPGLEQDPRDMPAGQWRALASALV